MACSSTHCLWEWCSAACGYCLWCKLRPKPYPSSVQEGCRLRADYSICSRSAQGHLYGVFSQQHQCLHFILCRVGFFKNCSDQAAPLSIHTGAPVLQGHMSGDHALALAEMGHQHCAFWPWDLTWTQIRYLFLFQQPTLPLRMWSGARTRVPTTRLDDIEE